MDFHPNDVILAAMALSVIGAIVWYTLRKSSKANKLLIAAKNMLAIAPKSSKERSNEMLANVLHKK